MRQPSFGREALPSAAECERLAADYVVVPVWREMLADMLTPVRAYQLLAAEGGPGFLLESVAGSERLARYSFLGFRARPLDLSAGDPLPALRSHTQAAVAPVPGLPRFYGGAVGYLGYEAAGFWERLPQASGVAPGLPANAWLAADNLVIFDHVEGNLKLLTLHRPQEEGYGDALARLDAMEAALAVELPARGAKPAGGGRWESNTTPEAFCAKVEAARAAIYAGEAFQVVVSQRFAKPLGARPLDLYRCLRTINPSPYMFFLDFGGGRQVIGASPEKLVSVEDGRVETRPLAGTRRRGATIAEDAELEQALRRDPKERAEHMMLVDLGRNDLSRVCRPGSVKVEALMAVERYSHVMHLSSTVVGELEAGYDALDALRAAFPAGTVSGAPKIRAMELIAALEPDRRGVYAGALGYVGFGGHLDMAITLRTLVVAEGVVYAQAGAGVVAASVPEREHQETLDKASAAFAAVAMAEAMP